MNRLTVLGSVNADHVLYMDYFPKPGETLIGHGYQVISGGKGANQAVASARMKTDTAFIASIGDDSFGQGILKTFQEEGIDVTGISINQGVPTGIAMIQVNSMGENCICLSPESNALLSVDQVQKNSSLIINSSMLLMQLETPVEGILAAAHIASQNKIKVVLNPAPAKKLPDELLKLVTMITPNETEAEILTGISVSDSPSAQLAANCLHQKGIKTVLITMGSKGVYLSEEVDQKSIGAFIPSFKVEAKDTTAAGDTFNAALLSELLNDKTMHEAILFAHAAAAISVTRLGAQTSIPRRDEVRSFLDERCNN